MLSILIIPRIHFGVNEKRASGIKKMAIMTTRDKSSIEDYFNNVFVIESQPKDVLKKYYWKLII